MPIFFSTSKPTQDRKKMYVPNDAESIDDLQDYDDIKKGDLVAGTTVGAEPSVERTGIDLRTHTYTHGEEGFLADIKRRLRG